MERGNRGERGEQVMRSGYLNYLASACAVLVLAQQAPRRRRYMYLPVGLARRITRHLTAWDLGKTSAAGGGPAGLTKHMYLGPGPASHRPHSPIG